MSHQYYILFSVILDYSYVVTSPIANPRSHDSEAIQTEAKQTRDENQTQN